jgi:hypothetical protein
MPFTNERSIFGTDVMKSVLTISRRPGSVADIHERSVGSEVLMYFRFA